MFLPHDLYLNLGGLQQHLDAVTVESEVSDMKQREDRLEIPWCL
jgi:hypothetical protein